MSKSVEDVFREIQKEPDPVKKIERLEYVVVQLIKANRILESEKRMLMETFDIEEITLEPVNPVARA